MPVGDAHDALGGGGDAVHKEQGKTILLITHSRELAAECERIITIRDGRITGEVKGGAAQ